MLVGRRIINCRKTRNPKSIKLLKQKYLQIDFSLRFCSSCRARLRVSAAQKGAIHD